MDDDYEELGFGGLDYFLPGVDLTLWLRLILVTVAIVVLAVAVILKT
jgi:hypothetical protein